jgi:hypothetical protein
MSSSIAKVAAAATVIIVVLVGVELFSSSDEAASVVELERVEQMFADGDVDGLVSMLSTGQSESKVAAAKCLAEMDVGTEVLLALARASAAHGANDPENTFERAIEKIRNRIEPAGGESPATTLTAKANSSTTSEAVRSLRSVNTRTRRGRPFKSRRTSTEEIELSIASDAPAQSLPDQAKEVVDELASADSSAESEESSEPTGESWHFEGVAADGYPVRGGYSSIAQVVPSGLNQDVVAYYSFNAGSDADTVADISGRGYHGQVQGAHRVNDEVLGGAMSFDGKDDQISIPDVDLEQFTFSAWVAPGADGLNNRRIFSLGDGESCYALQGNTGGGVGVYVADGVEMNEYNWHLDPDTWTHVTVTGDGRTFSIYKNGRLTEAGEIEMETVGVTGTLSIGGAGDAGGRPWNGFMDEVAVFGRALTDEEVEQLYLMTGEMIEVTELTAEPMEEYDQTDELLSADRSGESEESSELMDELEYSDPVVADGYPVRGGYSSVGQVVPSSLYQNLAAYYSFQTASDTDTVTDISGRGYHGQVHGAQHVNDDVLGGAMDFDGEDDRISIPDVHLEQFTFSAWVAPVDGDLNNRQIFLLTDGENCYALQGNSGGSVGVYVADGVEMNEGDWRLAHDTWTHLTVTGEGRTFSIYKNGRLTETGDIEIETNGVAGTLHIGGADRDGGRYWKGFMDEVGVFGRALTDAEVEQLYRMTGEMTETSQTTR